MLPPRVCRSMLSAAIALVLCLGASADEKPVSKVSGWQRLFREQAAGYRVVVEGGEQPEVKLLDEPILQWSQPVRGGADGTVFLWAQDGCPAAIGTFFIWPMGDGRQGITHELHSLSQSPLTARWRDRKWTPPKDSVTWTTLADTTPAAGTPEQRLRQMRDLAREFHAQSRDKNDRVWELRLLPRPIYRYELRRRADANESQRELIDGALFGFVEGTDLEVVLLLEAHRTTDGDQWQHAAARMSDFSLKMTRGGKMIWEVGPAGYDDPRVAYYCSTVETRRSPDEEGPASAE